MDENTFRLIAEQLRKPEGEMGIEIANRMNSGNELMNRRTIKKLDVQPDDYILEIGMGNGFFVKDILSVSPSVKYFGCDYSELMIEEASRINKKFIQQWRASFFLTSNNHLPFEVSCFDKIFTVNTIYFWDDPEKFLSEVKRVLRPSGIFIITFRPKHVMDNYPVAKYGFKIFSSEDVEPLLSANDFKLVSIEEEDEPGRDFEGNEVVTSSVVVISAK